MSWVAAQNCDGEAGLREGTLLLARAALVLIDVFEAFRPEVRCSVRTSETDPCLAVLDVRMKGAMALRRRPRGRIAEVGELWFLLSRVLHPLPLARSLGGRRVRDLLVREEVRERWRTWALLQGWTLR